MGPFHLFSFCSYFNIEYSTRKWQYKIMLKYTKV